MLTPDQQQRFHDNLVLFKDRFGRNPFNVGSDEKGAPPANPGNVSDGTNLPATNAPTEAK
jgi:hypothetical protein